MAAFLVCGVAEDIYYVPENVSHSVLSGPTADANQYCSLLDRCGMSVIIDQVTFDGSPFNCSTPSVFKYKML
jgi:vacuolar protein sorting-associated protein 13A/C